MKRKNISKKLGTAVMALVLTASAAVPSAYGTEWKMLETASASVTSQSSQMKITKKTYSYDFKTKDGRTYKKISFEYPQAAGSSDAAQAFNKFYQNLLSKWKKAAKEDLEEAKEVALGREDDGVCYADEVSCEITSADSSYISVMQSGYVYTMGAHGMPYRYTYIFDAKTGQKVSAAKVLGLTKKQLNKKVRSLYLKKFDQEKSNKDGSPFYESRDAVEKTLNGIDFNQNLYYLKNGKVRFYVDPYTAGPYAAGFIETAVKL